MRNTSEASDAEMGVSRAAVMSPEPFKNKIPRFERNQIRMSVLLAMAYANFNSSMSNRVLFSRIFEISERWLLLTAMKLMSSA